MACYKMTIDDAVKELLALEENNDFSEESNTALEMGRASILAWENMFELDDLYDKYKISNTELIQRQDDIKRSMRKQLNYDFEYDLGNEEVER